MQQNLHTAHPCTMRLANLWTYQSRLSREIRSFLYLLRFSVLSAGNRRSSDIKKLKHRHFERHTLKRKWDLFPLAWTLPNLFVFTLTETICLKIWAKPLSKGAKKATSVDVRRPGTSWLKLVDMSYSFQSMCHLLNHLTHYLLVSFVVVFCCCLQAYPEYLITYKIVKPSNAEASP